MTSANVLAISEQPVDFQALHAALDGARHAGVTAFRLLEPSHGMADGLRRAAAGGVDVLIVDAAGAPDQALETVVRARSEAPHIPLVVLGDAADVHGTLGAQAVAAGAQDVLARDQIGAGVLVRVLHYAIERQKLQDTMQELALSDPQTGLYTRRGFTALLEHHIKLAPRTRGLLIVAAGMKQPPHEGAEGEHDPAHRALGGAVEVLQATFRASDVIARLEGSAFAILVLDASDDAFDPIAARLRANLDQYNTTHAAPDGALSFAVSLTRIDPGASLTAEEILGRAMEGVRPESA
jgi:diguanylate cyclase (GGDEF)-like protein